MKDSWLKFRRKNSDRNRRSIRNRKGSGTGILKCGSQCGHSDMAETAPDLEAGQDQFAYIRTDVTKPQEVEEMVQKGN